MKDMVFKGPSQRANGKAMMFESVAMILVVKNSVPSPAAETPCTEVKKYVSHDGEAMPDAKESIPKRKSSRERTLKDSRET